MRIVVCPYCQERVALADAFSEPRCPRCDRLVTAPATYKTTTPRTHASHDIAASAQPEYCPAPPKRPEPPAGPYASWAELRAQSPAVQEQLFALATRVLPDLSRMRHEPLPVDLPDSADALGCPLASMTLPASHRLGWLLNWLVPSDVHVWLCEHGLLLLIGAQVAACRWDEVEDFKANLDGLQPCYSIMPPRELSLVLALAHQAEFLPLAEYMEIKLASSQLLPRLERIVAGERVRFGSVVLDRRGLAAPRCGVRWSAIVRVMANRTSFFVERRDQAQWREFRYRDVSHPLLVLAIAHILIEEAKRLPPPAA